MFGVKYQNFPSKFCPKVGANKDRGTNTGRGMGVLQSAILTMGCLNETKHKLCSHLTCISHSDHSLLVGQDSELT